MSTRKFTLKKDGKYWSRLSTSSPPGFCALGIAGCYSYDLETIRNLQAMVGGEIVEVIHEGGWQYTEKPYTEKYYD